MLQFFVNDKKVTTDCSPGMVALDFIREQLKLTGTKEGCKEGECGACTVLVGELQKEGYIKYQTAASCLLPIGALNGKHIVTVEGVNFSEDLNFVQQKIFENNASQCGFCTPGIILSLIGFLLTSNNFSYDDAVNALDGNICRCTGYYPIRNAARDLSTAFKNEKCDFKTRVDCLINKNVLPEYFSTITEKLTYTQSVKFGETDGELVAGGTDLFVQKPEELYNSKPVFLSEMNELNYIKVEKSYIAVGGNVTVEQFRKSKVVNDYFSSLKEDLLLVSSTLMRNKATLTGNIVNASPIGDLTIILLALDAELVLTKENNTRNIKLKKFYSGYKKFDLRCREIIIEIRIPKPNGVYEFSFEKVSNRKYLDIASSNSALLVEFEDNKIKKLNISVGGVAPIPMLLNKSTEKVVGKKVNSETVDKLINDIDSEIAPIDDIRGTAKYKKMLTKQLIKAHFIKLFEDKVEDLEVMS